MEQALVKSVFLNAETLPPECFETHSYKLDYVWGRLKKKRRSRESHCLAGSTLVKGAGEVDFEIFFSKVEKTPTFILQPEIGNS